MAGVAVAAESRLERVLAEALKDHQRAPAIVAAGAEQTPRLVVPMISAAVTALPDQAVEIFTAVLLALPKYYVAITRAAVLAQPKLALEFASAGVAVMPDQAKEILNAAHEAAPEEARSSIASLLKPSFLDKVRRNRVEQRTAFPPQPLQPDLVSPSR